MCGSTAHGPGEDPVPHMWVQMGYQLLPYLVSPPSELPGGRWGAGAPGTHGRKRHGLCPFVTEACPKYQQLPDPWETRSTGSGEARQLLSESVLGVIKCIDPRQTAWDQILALLFTS